MRHNNSPLLEGEFFRRKKMGFVIETVLKGEQL
jgi:hypothetical protein